MDTIYSANILSTINPVLDLMTRLGKDPKTFTWAMILIWFIFLLPWYIRKIRRRREEETALQQTNTSDNTQHTQKHTFSDEQPHVEPYQWDIKE